MLGGAESVVQIDLTTGMEQRAREPRSVFQQPAMPTHVHDRTFRGSAGGPCRRLTESMFSPSGAK